MKEFEKIDIPHADSFVFEYNEKRKVEDANRKFNSIYKNSKLESQIVLKFSDDVEIFYFENESSELYIS